MSTVSEIVIFDEIIWMKPDNIKLEDTSAAIMMQYGAYSLFQLRDIGLYSTFGDSFRKWRTSIFLNIKWYRTSSATNSIAILTAFCSLCLIDDFAKTLLYWKVPRYFNWNASRKQFKRHKQGKAVTIIIHFIHNLIFIY